MPKWEKNRSKILAELTLTLAELTLTMTKKRQRRRIAGNRSRRTDKYPLASNPLPAESASKKQSVQTLVKKKLNLKSNYSMAQKKLQNLKKAASGSRDSRKDTP